MNIPDEVQEIIEDNPLALATTNKDGKPNVIAVAFVKVADSSKLVITDNYMQETKTNVKEREEVCLAVWNDDWEGYKIRGEAEYHDTGKWKDFVEEIPENKEEPAEGAVVVEVSDLKEL